MIFIHHPFQSKLKCLEFDSSTVRVSDIRNTISSYFGCNEFALYQNGRKVSEAEYIPQDSTIHVTFTLPGGKGGFGSMLRAIGAQIEKTTNREACRDLSGRRLRDINEEQRLKKWIAKKAEREAEKIRRRKERLERLKSKPAHKFFDFEYEKEISQVPERVNDALNEGLQKAKDPTKRPAEDASLSKPPKKTWLSEEFSSSSDSDSGENSLGNEISSSKQKTDPIDSEISELSQQDPSCSDVSEQCPSFSDASQQGPNCSDVSQQEPSCSDLSQQGPSCSDVSKRGPSCSNVFQQGPTSSKYEPYYEMVDNSQYNFDSAHRSDVQKKENNLLDIPENQFNKESVCSERSGTDQSRSFEIRDFAGAFDQTKDSESGSESSKLASIGDQQSGEEKKEETAEGKPAELDISKVADSTLKSSSEFTNENEDFTPIELLDFQNVSDLEALGLERLKLELVHRGLKCGGTLSDRAKRLWLVRGLKPDDYPANVLAKKKK